MSKSSAPSKKFLHTDKRVDKVPEHKKRDNINKFAALDISDSEEEVVSLPKRDPKHDVENNSNDNVVVVSDNNDKYVFSGTKKHISSNMTGHDEWATIKKSRQKRRPEFNKRVTMMKIDEHADEHSEKHLEEDNKQLYIENVDNVNELGNNMFFNSPWTVWVHKSDCQVWTEDSYTNIYVINSIGSFWRFFNNFHLLDKVRNQLFIMRNKVKPIWEDNENRNGGICSVKLDCYSRQGKTDVGVEAMICLCLLIMNETFIPNNNDEINGISYSIKNRSVLIKLWCKNFNTKITEKIPTGFFNKLDSILKGMDKYSFGKKADNKLSIRYTQIKPEYELEVQ